MVLSALAEGVGVAVASHIFGHSEYMIQIWLTGTGVHAQSLHALHLGHVQLDEVRTTIRHDSQIVWVWIGIDAGSELIAAIRIGPPTQDMAHAIKH